MPLAVKIEFLFLFYFFSFLYWNGLWRTIIGFKSNAWMKFMLPSIQLPRNSIHLFTNQVLIINLRGRLLWKF